jgi:hypothetical protein
LILKSGKEGGDFILQFFFHIITPLPFSENPSTARRQKETDRMRRITSGTYGAVRCLIITNNDKELFMSKKMLTPGMVREIQRLRAELNEWGEAKFTGADIAQVLGISESTVWRVVRKKAAYARIDLALTPKHIELSNATAALQAMEGGSPPMSPAAEESLRRVQALLKADVTAKDSMLESLPLPVREKAKELL